MSQQQPNPDQAKVLALMEAFTTAINEAYKTGAATPHAMSALLNSAAVLAVQSGGKSKEFGITARNIFNEIRTAMKAGR
jgi:hypothetical protein